MIFGLFDLEEIEGTRRPLRNVPRSFSSDENSVQENICNGEEYGLSRDTTTGNSSPREIDYLIVGLGGAF